MLLNYPKNIYHINYGLVVYAFMLQIVYDANGTMDNLAKKDELVLCMFLVHGEKNGVT